jgi:hypothetical protein
VRAEEFAARASSELDPVKRAEYEALSLGYLRLAAQAERNSKTDVVFEPSTDKPQLPQQQQTQQKPK